MNTRMVNHKPIEWVGRTERPVKTLAAQVDAEFHEKVMAFCEEHSISFSSFMRFELSKAMKAVG